MKLILSLLCLTLIQVLLISGTISPSNKKKNKPSKKEKEILQKSGPTTLSVFDRGLIDEEPLAADIIAESAAYYKDTKARLFNSTILGYVTPWNNHGYDVAKIWGAKLDLISPVWLQIHRTGDRKYQIGGSHDIDAGWMAEVRKGGPKILPRILFDKFREQDFTKMLASKEERAEVSKLIVDTCKKHKFDGIVLEVWSTLSVRVDDELLITLVEEIALSLRYDTFDLILVVPPMRNEPLELFRPEHFERLHRSVTGFSLMTYDFSSFQRPGANAPLYWVQEAVEYICPEGVRNVEEKRAKILLGLNFYGNDYTPEGGGAIVGNQYLELVKHVKGRLTLDERDVENFFEIRRSDGRHTVFYPTLYSIYERIRLARKLGTGISIWELGQGLDYFYDLF